MKLLGVISFLALTATSCAQYLAIAFPPPGGNLLAGQPFIVELDRPGRATGITEVGIVVGLASCVAAPCQPPTVDVGLVLYRGSYSPVIHTTSKPPYQSFSFTIPPNFTKGLAQLNVLHNSTLSPNSIPFFQAATQELHIF